MVVAWDRDFAASAAYIAEDEDVQAGCEEIDEVSVGFHAFSTDNFADAFGGFVGRAGCGPGQQPRREPGRQ